MSLDGGNVKAKFVLDLDPMLNSVGKASTVATDASLKIGEALKKAYGPGTAEAQKFGNEIADNVKRMHDLSGATNSFGGSLSSIMNLAAGTALGGIFSGGLREATQLVGTVQNLLEKSLQLAAASETTELSFRVMVGDAAQADKLLRDLRAFANTTPFEFAELANAGKQLLAMGIGAGDVVDSLRMLGDVSSGLNQPVGEMAYLFGQIRSQGRAMTQDLNQFAGRGVPIYTALQKVLNATDLEVRNLAADGKIGFAEIVAAFRSMTDEGGRFYRMTAQQAETLKGLYSTLQDAIATVEVQLGKAIATGADGQGILKDLTRDVEKFGPSVVDLGVSLAQAFHNALPYMKAAASYLEAMAAQLGVIDMNKVHGNPYATNKAPALEVADTSKESVDRLNKIQEGITNASKAAKTGADAIRGQPFKFATALVNAADQLEVGVKASDAAMQAINAATEQGSKVSDQQLAKAKTALQNNLKLIATLNESIETAKTEFGEFTLGEEKLPGLEAMQRQLREAQVVSGAAIAQFEKIAAAKKAADDKAKADAVAAAKTAVSPPGLTPPAEPGKSAGGKSAFDLSGEFASTEIAAMEAAGEKVKAELARAKLAFDRDIERIAKAYESGGMDSIGMYGAQADSEQRYQNERQRIIKKAGDDNLTEKKKRAEDEQEIETRKAGYRRDIEANIARLNGDLRKAELIEFDAMWDRKLSKIEDASEKALAIELYESTRRLKIAEIEAEALKKIQEGHASPLSVGPTTLAEASRRMKAAPQGSGERELSRLDFRSLSGTLTHDEEIRRERLANRFNRSLVGPSPLQAAAPLLRRSTANADDARGMPGSISPNVNIDVPQITTAVAAATEKGVTAAMRKITTQLRDQNYADGVGMNL